jgi:hypothetical protein
MLETPEEIDRLQDLLDRSASAAGPHLRSIITVDRRLTATQVCDLLQGLRLLVVTTVSATYLPGEELAVTVHGRAELFEVNDPARGGLRQAMLDHYLPLQGPAFEEWLDRADALGARIVAEKMLTFRA